ncbi:hypothetical protein EYZ11_004244 [Aspergillus tanneri]|uniref:Uncharacterized protein n=1 Tax=Aspergillus tanneri TaxID=1220188 RepID=A0A4V3UPS7_9EURO|nr:hypothetical protein EYZ11_004244 [Aspergillus tanneri]
MATRKFGQACTEVTVHPIPAATFTPPWTTTYTS